MKKLTNIIIVFIFVFVALKYLCDFRKQRLLDSSYGITIGTITKYYEIGLSSFYMEYSYSIGSKTYKNEVNPDRIFKNCEDTHSCIDKKMFIKYYMDDPSISRPIFDSLPSPAPSSSKSSIKE
jgi:hypothetical protein